MVFPLIGSLLAGLGGGGAAAAGGAAPGIFGGLFGGGASGGGGLGGLLGGASDILGGLLGFGQNKLAKKTFNFQKDAFNANLANQVQSYNTSLEDRVRARHNTEGRTGAFTESYLGRNRLQNTEVG